MHLITLRPASDADYEFLYQLHKITLHDYVAQTWGWDEAWQQYHFKYKFNPAFRQIVSCNDADMGMIEVKPREREIFLASIQIHPIWQNRGIGTQLIKQVMADAFLQKMPVLLQVLKVNHPARKLYERLGFVVVDEDSTRFMMLATPNSS